MAAVLTAVLGMAIAAVVGGPAWAVNAEQPTVVSATPSGLLTDSGTAAPAGTVGGLTATTDAPGNKAVTLTIVLAQAS